MKLIKYLKYLYRTIFLYTTFLYFKILKVFIKVKNPKKFKLIISKLDGVGDFILSYPLLLIKLKNYENVDVLFLINKSNQEMFKYLFKDNYESICFDFKNYNFLNAFEIYNKLYNVYTTTYISLDLSRTYRSSDILGILINCDKYFCFKDPSVTIKNSYNICLCMRQVILNNNLEYDIDTYSNFINYKIQDYVNLYPPGIELVNTKLINENYAIINLSCSKDANFISLNIISENLFSSVDKILILCYPFHNLSFENQLFINNHNNFQLIKERKFDSILDLILNSKFLITPDSGFAHFNYFFNDKKTIIYHDSNPTFTRFLKYYIGKEKVELINKNCLL